jgi:hypothetical protein
MCDPVSSARALVPLYFLVGSMSSLWDVNEWLARCDPHVNLDEKDVCHLMGYHLGTVARSCSLTRGR